MIGTLDLYAKFAKTVNDFELMSAHQAANELHYLTLVKESKPSEFMFCENNTWRLLSLLTKNKERSKIHQLSLIKQWISQVPKDQELIDRIIEDREVEDEVNNLFKRNKQDKDEPRKKRIISPFKQHDVNSDEKEHIYKNQFEKLRSNDLSSIEVRTNRDITHNYVLNVYSQYQKMALEDTASEIIQKERTIWRKTVRFELEDTSIQKYKRALYNVLAGNATELYDSVCDTWEDIVWVYLNKRVEDLLDNPDKLDYDPILSTQVMGIALDKDNIMNSNDPRRIFHFIQASLLSDTTEELIKKIYLAFFQQDTDRKSLKITDDADYRAQLLRFIATMILFGNQYLGWKENKYSAALLSAYSELNAKSETLRPVVIASYAAKQSPEHQIQIYSNFLQNFEGDDEECLTLLQLGKEYGLNMRDILQFTYTHLFKKAIAKAPMQISDSSKTLIKFEIQNDTINGYELFYKAIKWLVYDENLCVEAIEAANMTIRYFLGLGKIYLVNKVFELFSNVVIAHMAFVSKENETARQIMLEFSLHRSLVKTFIDYEDWNKLMNKEPKDSGSYADLLGVYDWQNQVEKMTAELDTELNRVFEENWLGNSFNETAHISKSTLRQIYIPELIIRYHKLLLATSKIIPSNKEKSQKMNLYITDKHKHLFEDVLNAKRMVDVIDQISLSL